MTDFALYNIRRGPHGYTIAKFDRDLNLLAAYNVAPDYCDCPAGPRPTCRHRKMLPRMLGKVDTDSFYCYETQQWARPIGLEGEARQGSVTSLDEGQMIEAASEMLATPPSPEAAAMYANTELAPPIKVTKSVSKPTIRRR